MAQTIIINGVTYEVKELNAPLAADPTQLAVFPDTSDASDGLAGAMLEGYIGYAKGKKVAGSILNKGDGSGTISTKDGVVTLAAGYYSGGTIGLSEEEKAKIIAENIPQGMTLLGVTGTHTDPVFTLANGVLSIK